MKKPAKILYISLLIAVTAIGATACSHHHRSPEARADWMMKRISKHLDLNDQQQSKLQAVHTEMHQGMVKYHDRKQQQFDRLLAGVESPQLDKQLLLEIVESRKQAYDEFAPAVIEKLIEFHASLDAEQKKLAAEHLQDFRARFQQHVKGYAEMLSTTGCGLPSAPGDGFQLTR